MSRLLILILALAGTACSGSAPTAPATSVRQQLTLSPGQSATIEGTPYELRFERVDGDSRCPGDALCLTAGNAVVRVSVLTARTRRSYELHTGSQQPFVFDEWTISLVQLDPYPFSSLPPIQPADYRATLLISR